MYLGMAAITYMLGAGIARYLGHETSPTLVGLGLLGVLLGQASMGLLEGVFRPLEHPLIQGESRVQRRALRNAALYAALAALTVVGLVGYAVRAAGGLTVPFLINQMLGLAVILLFAIPPLRLVDRGLGELLLAVQMAHVPTSAGFLLQAGNPHPLLYVNIGSLTLLLLATLLVLDFPSLGQDMRGGRATLPALVGWENAVRIHHVLLVGAFLILAAAPLSGFALGRFVPGFLTIPFAVLQAYLLHQIAGGAKPMWGLLKVNAVALFALTAYFLSLSFWFH